MFFMNNYGYYGVIVLCQVFFFQECYLFFIVKRMIDQVNYCLLKFKIVICGG